MCRQCSQRAACTGGSAARCTALPPRRACHLPHPPCSVSLVPPSTPLNGAPANPDLHILSCPPFPCLPVCDQYVCDGNNQCYTFADKARGYPPDGTATFPLICMETPRVSQTRGVDSGMQLSPPRRVLAQHPPPSLLHVGVTQRHQHAPLNSGLRLAGQALLLQPSPPQSAHIALPSPNILLPCLSSPHPAAGLRPAG